MLPGKKVEESAPPASGADRISALPEDVLHHTAAAAVTPLPVAMGSGLGAAGRRRRQHPLRDPPPPAPAAVLSAARLRRLQALAQPRPRPWLRPPLSPPPPPQRSTTRRLPPYHAAAAPLPSPSSSSASSSRIPLPCSRAVSETKARGRPRCLRDPRRQLGHLPATYSASAEDARQMFDGMPPGKKDEESAPPASGADRIGALPDDVLHHTAAAALTPLPFAMGSEGWTLPDGVDDNILSEILLRLPPLPSSLPRASAVCKRWHSLACDPGFCRRFRRHHHHNPPLLGFFDHPDEFEPTLDAPNRVPPGRFSLLLDDHFSYGSRNGLVLLFMSEQDEDHYSHILVWDPLTGDQYHIDFPPDVLNDNPIIGALLPRDDVHFRVVLVLAENEDVGRPRRALARVYSSQTSSWGDLMSVPVPPLLPPQASTRKYHRLFMDAIPAVLVGDSLYWQLGSSLLPGILEFNLERQRLDVIRAPVDMYPDELRDRYPCFSVIRAEDGGLGFLSLSGFTAQVWKGKTDNDGVASWVLGRTIQLDKLLSLNPQEHKLIFVRGYAEENNYVLLRTVIGLFMLQLHSLQFRFFEDSETIDIPYYSCLPFESVFAAGT